MSLRLSTASQIKPRFQGDYNQPGKNFPGKGHADLPVSSGRDGFSVGKNVVRLGFERPTHPIINVPGFSQEDLGLIEKKLRNYKYRKPLSRMVQKDSPFKVTVDGDTVTIRGMDFYTPEEGQKVEGVCHELSHFLMKDLEKTFGRKYEFASVVGNCEPYFNAPGTNHTFLIARKKARLPFASGLKQVIDKHMKAEASGLPPDCLLIDPSFGLLCNTNDINTHTVTRVLSTDARKTNFQASSHVKSDTLDSKVIWPLGYMSELFDNLIPKADIEPHKALIFWGVKSKPGHSPDIALYLQRPQDEGASRIGNFGRVLQAEPADNLLRQFVNRVHQDLGHRDTL